MCHPMMEVGGALWFECLNGTLRYLHELVLILSDFVFRVPRTDCMVGTAMSYLFFEALVSCGYTVHIQAYVTVLPSHETQTVICPQWK
jgi:hypothetical protein